MANRQASVVASRAADQIVAALVSKYPNIVFPHELKNIIEDYIDMQRSSQDCLINSAAAPATRPSSTSETDGASILYDAVHKRFYPYGADQLLDKDGNPALDANGNPLKIDLQAEVLSYLSKDIISSIELGERTIISMIMCYDIQTNGSIKSRNKPLDFSNLYGCGHMIGLPLKSDFQILASQFKKFCQSKGISMEVSFPANSTVGREFMALKKDVKDFFINYVPNVASLEEYQKFANAITMRIKSFCDQYKDVLTEKETYELTEIMSLVSCNIKNMERLFYNDLEETLAFLDSPEFSSRIYEIFNYTEVYMLNSDGELEILDIDSYNGDQQKLLENIHLFLDENGSPLFPELNGTPLHPNVINKMVKKDLQYTAKEAMQVVKNQDLEYYIDVFRDKSTSEEDKEASLGEIIEICQKLRYVPNIKIADLLKQINVYLFRGNDEINPYLKDLKKALEDRQNGTNYNPRIAYLNSKFKIDLMRTVISEYQGDLSKFRLWPFYQEHMDKFPYTFTSNEMPKLKSFDEQYNNFELKEDCDIFFEIKTPEQVAVVTEPLLKRLISHFERVDNNKYFYKKNLDINDYLFYQELKTRIDAKLDEIIGIKKGVYGDKFEQIDKLFNQGNSLTASANMLDRRRIDLETRISMYNLEHGFNFDPLLVFKTWCEHDDGKTFEEFIRSQSQYTINFAKMVSKLPIFNKITGITGANLEFRYEKNGTEEFIARGNAQLLFFTGDGHKSLPARSLRTDSNKSNMTAKVVYFKNTKALNALRKLHLDRTGLYTVDDELITIPNTFPRASKVA